MMTGHAQHVSRIQWWCTLAELQAMEPIDGLDGVQLYEDVKTEVVESCYSLHELASPKKRKSKSQEDMHDKPKKPR